MMAYGVGSGARKLAMRREVSEPKFLVESPGWVTMMWRRWRGR